MFAVSMVIVYTWLGEIEKTEQLEWDPETVTDTLVYTRQSTVNIQRYT